jgi:hypothetical protein
MEKVLHQGPDDGAKTESKQKISANKIIPGMVNPSTASFHGLPQESICTGAAPGIPAVVVHTEVEVNPSVAH